MQFPDATFEANARRKLCVDNFPKILPITLVPMTQMSPVRHTGAPNNLIREGSFRREMAQSK